MTASNGNHARVDRLEQRLRPRCRTCGGYPIRVVIEDVATGWTDESMPRSGCPDCGRPIRQTVNIIGDAGDEGESCA